MITITQFNICKILNKARKRWAERTTFANNYVSSYGQSLESGSVIYSSRCQRRQSARRYQHVRTGQSGAGWRAPRTNRGDVWRRFVNGRRGLCGVVRGGGVRRWLVRYAPTIPRAIGGSDARQVVACNQPIARQPAPSSNYYVRIKWSFHQGDDSF